MWKRTERQAAFTGFRPIGLRGRMMRPTWPSPRVPPSCMGWPDCRPLTHAAEDPRRALFSCLRCFWLAQLRKTERIVEGPSTRWPESLPRMSPGHVPSPVHSRPIMVRRPSLSARDPGRGRRLRRPSSRKREEAEPTSACTLLPLPRIGFIMSVFLLSLSPALSTHRPPSFYLLLRPSPHRAIMSPPVSLIYPSSFLPSKRGDGR